LTELKKYSEPELVAALKDRSSEAYRYLYYNYRGSLYAVIVQLVPNTETANDVLQELFITVWKNIDRYQPEKGKLYTWLLNLARNTAINKLRSKNYKNEKKNEDITNYVNTIDEKNNVQQPSNHIGLRKEVSKLKDEYRQLVELSYFHGFTQDEISKALNIPLGTIKTRLRNALIELRKHFR
jgi:RNA polymerase sigma factor (sigma-70 family)